MAFGNIAGRAAFLLDLDKSALDTGLPAAERQFAASTERMAKSADGVADASGRAGNALGGGGGGIGLVGRMGLVGAAVNVAFQGFQHLQAGLKVTGAEAGATEGRFRNLGAELMTGDVVGGIMALRKESYATDQQLAEMALTAEEAAGRLDLIEASAAASSIGLNKLAGQIDAVVAAAQRIDTTKLAFDPNAQFGANPAAVSGQKSFGIGSLGDARQKAADLRNKNAAERRAELDQRAPSSIVDRINRASLTGGLGDDLSAATAQEAYFANRLRGVKKGSARYSTILESLRQAHAARQSIVDQMTAAEKSAADKEKSAAAKAAADRKRAADEAARAAEAAKAEDARKLRAGLTLREATLRNNLAEAELTEKNVNDDKAALRKLIAFDRAQQKNRQLTQIERQQFRTKEIQDRKALAGLGQGPQASSDQFGQMAQAFLERLSGQAKAYASNVTVVQHMHANTPPFQAARDARRAAEAVFA